MSKRKPLSDNERKARYQMRMRSKGDVRVEVRLPFAIVKRLDEAAARAGTTRSKELLQWLEAAVLFRSRERKAKPAP